MTKYNSAARRRQIQKPDQPHPVWRGIGCMIMVITPLISYAAAKLTIDFGLKSGWVIPYQLLGNPTLPDYVYDVPVLAFLLAPITNWTNLYAYLAVGLMYLMIFGGLLSFTYALTYRFVGPPRWGPLDIPPPRGKKPKPYKR